MPAAQSLQATKKGMVIYMSSCDIVTLVTALACGIAKCVPKEDLPLITSIFGQLASTLATITIQKELLKGSNTSPPNVAPGVEIITAPLRF